MGIILVFIVAVFFQIGVITCIDMGIECVKVMRKRKKRVLRVNSEVE